MAILESEYLKEIACYNPQLAYRLATCGSPIRPHIYTIHATFTSATPDVPIDGTLDLTGLCNDFWVQSLEYTVRRPNAFAGNIFKPQNDVNNSIIPYIDASIVVQGGFCGDSVLSVKLEPLELLAQNPQKAGPSCCDWLRGLVLTWCESVNVEFVLRRTLASDEIPTEVILAFKGYSLGCQRYGGITVEAAKLGLISLGLLGDPDRK